MTRWIILQDSLAFNCPSYLNIVAFCYRCLSPSTIVYAAIVCVVLLLQRVFSNARWNKLVLYYVSFSGIRFWLKWHVAGTNFTVWTVLEKFDKIRDKGIKLMPGTREYRKDKFWCVLIITRCIRFGAAYSARPVPRATFLLRHFASIIRRLAVSNDRFASLIFRENVRDVSQYFSVLFKGTCWSKTFSLFDKC